MTETMIFGTAEELDRHVAAELVRQVTEKPRSVIGLSTGKTTGPIHVEVCKLFKERPFRTDELTVFGLDEVTGVPREFSGACYTMLLREIVKPLGIRPENFLMLPVASRDFAADCEAFTRELERRGGIDWLLLGLGTNCHLGFNQPGTPFGSSAHQSWMTRELEERLRGESGTAPGVTLGGVTLGITDIMHARRIVMAAKGEDKAEAVRSTLQEPVSEEFPSTVLRLHPCCSFILDHDAAKLL